jgi:hypothetical protein
VTLFRLAESRLRRFQQSLPPWTSFSGQQKAWFLLARCSSADAPHTPAPTLSGHFEFIHCGLSAVPSNTGCDLPWVLCILRALVFNPHD